MQHKGTKTLKTSRLTLRQFVQSDSSVAHRNWFSDAATTKFLTWLPHESIIKSEEYVASCIASYQSDSFYLWTIVPDDLGEPIGTIAIVRPINQATATAHVGYCLGSKWWGRGYMPEALAAVIAYLFSEVGINRIETNHDVNNPNSGKVMLKCGMVKEGTLRQAERNNQGIVDVHVYGILREDYLKKQNT